MTDKDIQKIEVVKKILEKKFIGTDKESDFFSYEELATEPILTDQMGVNRIFEIIQESSNKNITLKIIEGRHKLPDTAAGGIGQMSDLHPIGIGVYVSDLEKLNDFFKSILQYPILLSEHEVEFDSKKGIITVNGRSVVFPANGNEQSFCKIMFDTDNPVGIPVDWTTLSREIRGVDPMSTDASKEEMEKWTRSVRDTMYAVNERVQKDLNTKDELFSWTEKSVKRNF